MPKTALITGITGQDGSFMAELLLKKGYTVVGLARTVQYMHNIQHIIKDLQLYQGDVTDSSQILTILQKHKPDEIYNLAGVSSIQDCWSSPLYSMQVNTLAPVQIIDAVIKLNLSSKFLQATSREIFGNYAGLIDESVPYSTENPYAVTKLAGHLMLDTYRKNYNVFACSAILFNHESHRRSTKFVTRKITNFASCAKPGNVLYLGNLKAQRDWGYAGDFVEGMWRMLQAEQPNDYVLATGKLFSIEELCDIAFQHRGLDYRDYIQTDTNLLRKNDVEAPIGNFTKIRENLGWQPTTDFYTLITGMVEYDMEKNK